MQRHAFTEDIKYTLLLKKTDELRLVKFKRPNDDEAYGHGWLREVLGVSSLGNGISEVK